MLHSFSLRDVSCRLNQLERKVVEVVREREREREKEREKERERKQFSGPGRTCLSERFHY